MNLIYKISIVIIVLATGTAHGLLASPVGEISSHINNVPPCLRASVHLLAQAHCQPPATNSHINQTNLKSNSNIHIGKNTYLKFYGTSFKGKSIIGKGILVLSGTNLKLELNKATNLTINANKTSLTSNLTINNKFKIAMGSKLLLNNYNLMLTHQSYNNAIATIIENGRGQVLLISNPANHIQTELITITYNRLLTPNNICSTNCINVIQINFTIIPNNFYKHQPQAPPTPPPEI